MFNLICNPTFSSAQSNCFVKATFKAMGITHAVMFHVFPCFSMFLFCSCKVRLKCDVGNLVWTTGVALRSDVFGRILYAFKLNLWWFKVLQIKRLLCALCHCLSSFLFQIALECGAAGVLQCESADGSGAAASRFHGGCIHVIPLC